LVHNCVGIADKIPPSLPFPKGGIPLFEKRGKGRFLEELIAIYSTRRDKWKR